MYLTSTLRPRFWFFHVRPVRYMLRSSLGTHLRFSVMSWFFCEYSKFFFWFTQFDHLTLEGGKIVWIRKKTLSTHRKIQRWDKNLRGNPNLFMAYTGQVWHGETKIWVVRSRSFTWTSPAMLVNKVNIFATIGQIHTGSLLIPPQILEIQNFGIFGHFDNLQNFG